MATSTTPTTIIAAATLIYAAFFAMAVPGGTAQSPAGAPVPVMIEGVPLSSPPSMSMAPAPGLDCLNYLVNMSDCLTYVEAGSNLTKPDKGCCPELAGLVESQPICLCQLLGNSDSLGVQINLNKALKLPSVCGVSTPPISMCSVAGYPVGAPTSSEGPTISPGGSPPEGAAIPALGNVNGASSIAVSHLSFLVGLAIAFISSL
ncbi:non-specific lipid transfer protein GPI-anchored 11-like isoform X3 [Cornus florida]|uniref:non-specific lipid transfer protein GPI-anchored 11-like isoform X2 n=1 Tax=Cornus florida TaxID=4283 RepID=UPI0028A12032|nr:non-specific lipid transfer protein GPI-anchored 11-like isoform X2 [Cornus florida]XP_059625081.1 non-specific lipid transfer protein GPI-anchored 11-like isoform X3 [Cornus florida]